MKRRVVLKGIMLSLVVILAVVLFGCEKDDRVLDPVLQPTDQEVLIGVEGGVIAAMDGDVVITIPAGALTESVRFVVHDLLNKSARMYALKEIVIEPVVVFKKPVQLTIKYDGCLGNGVDLCDAASVSFLIWNSEADFIRQKTPLVCTCCNVNGELHTVCNCIAQTGVIAVLAEW
jgi:hypothetical protein